MLVSSYAVVGLVALVALGIVLLGLALWRPNTTLLKAPASWKSYHFGYVVYALIFLSFDMEMIFMYPWAVVFVEKGVEAFLDMLVFIAILSAGISYAWVMGGLEWE